MYGSVSITFSSIVSRGGENAEQKKTQALQKTQAQCSSRIRSCDKECPVTVLDQPGVICLRSDLVLYPDSLDTD